MSEEKDLEQLKKEAVAKAKAAALAKMQAKQAAANTENPSTSDDEKAKAIAAAKAKAAAAAKAKAAALAKQQGEESTTPAANDDEKAKAIAAAKAKAAAAAKAKAAALAKQQGDETATPAASDDEKAKAIAAAKAKAVAAAKAKAAALAKQQGDGSSAQPANDDEKAKAIAAAKAKAAAAAAARAKSKGTEVEEPSPIEETPSPNQVYLDKYVKVIEEHLGKEVLASSYINKLSKDVPTLEAKPESYYKIAEFLRYNEQLSFDYLSEFHGSDFETHMEVYAHLYSYKNRQTVALKVKIARDEPAVESLSALWAGANWPECEAYDLLGIQFKNHPKLYRIMLGDDWIGHPLRKDYEPYDVEV